VLVGTDDVPLELATEVTDDEALVLVLVPARLLTTLSRGRTGSADVVEDMVDVDDACAVGEGVLAELPDKGSGATPIRPARPPGDGARFLSRRVRLI